MRRSAIIFSLLFAAAAFGQTTTELFQKGNELFRAGRYDEAAASYQRVLSQDVESAALYYNLGNCYYRMGKTAPAVLAYERAHRLAPGDPDIQHNLKLVNLKLRDRIEPVPELFLKTWLHTLASWITSGTAAWLFILGWIGCFGSLAAGFLLANPRTIRLLRFVALGTGVIALLSGSLVVLHYSSLQSRDDAIIVVSVLTAKTSPDAQSVDTFVVHEGLKVKVSDAVGEWVKITLPDGKVGWILARECEKI